MLLTRVDCKARQSCLKMSANYFPKFEFFLPPRVGDVSRKAKEILLFAFLAWFSALRGKRPYSEPESAHLLFLSSPDESV
jgi:hypothetical protein